jgi:protein-L-isoaspartate(D-aspartate) O-methyltransferase
MGLGGSPAWLLLFGVILTVRRTAPADLVAAARAAGVTDQRLLDAIAAVPRADFVPPELTDSAYDDIPVPILRDQVTTQPSLVAQMVAALELSPSDKVLEVGTGFGWQTALLARVAGRVWSVERWEDIAAAARARLAGFDHVSVVVGDGSLGLPEHAPFEAILVSAAFPEVPTPLAQQLADDGRLVQPIGRGVMDDVILFERRGPELRRSRFVTGAHFVRLYGEHAFDP